MKRAMKRKDIAAFVIVGFVTIVVTSIFNLFAICNLIVYTFMRVRRWMETPDTNRQGDKVIW